METQSHDWLSSCFCCGSMRILSISCHSCLSGSLLFFRCGDCPCISQACTAQALVISCLESSVIKVRVLVVHVWLSPFHVCFLYHLCKCWMYRSTIPSKSWVPLWEYLALKCLRTMAMFWDLLCLGKVTTLLSVSLLPLSCNPFWI